MHWDTYFLKICDTVALRSKDADTKLGCVITDKFHRIVGTGYNSLPAGVDDSNWPVDRTTKFDVIKHAVTGTRIMMATGYDPENYTKLGEVTKYDVMVHAEVNAIVNAVTDLHGCTLYCGYMPCHECTKAIINAGIKTVIYKQINPRFERSYAISKELFEEAHVECVMVKEEE